VGWSQKLHVRSELAVGADGDGRDVESGEVVVDESAGADADVLAVVDVKRRLDEGAFPEAAEQLSQDRPSSNFVGDRRLVVRVPLSL
jgi:hypothetical protein